MSPERGMVVAAQVRTIPLVKAHEIDLETSVGRVSGVACCFCGEDVERTRIDPVAIHLTANDERVSQVFWAHSRCLVAARISDLRDEFYGDESGDP